jgi:hypothetical protein
VVAVAMWWRLQCGGCCTLNAWRLSSVAQ